MNDNSIKIVICHIDCFYEITNLGIAYLANPFINEIVNV